MLYSKEIPEADHYDVVECGGGFSGMAAAYSAARDGANALPCNNKFYLVAIIGMKDCLINHTIL